jgi:AcrR family transcriptional regulator
MYISHTPGKYEMQTSGRDAYHHGALRETIVSLALEALETAGPDGLSLSSLAKKARVSGMAPYRHFRDKSDLMHEVARRGFALLAEELSSADKLANPVKRLEAYGVAYVEFGIRRPGLFKTMFGGTPPTPDEESVRTDSVYSKFATLIAELSPPEKQEDLFLTCWAAMHGLACLCIARRLRGSTEKSAVLASRVAKTLEELFVVTPANCR